MTDTDLRLTRSALLRAVISGLSDAGYVFLPAAETLHKFFVRAVNGLAGASYSVFTTSYLQILARLLDQAAGGSHTPLVSTEADLLGSVYDALPFSGGGGGASHVARDDGLGNWTWDDGSGILWG